MLRTRRLTPMERVMEPSSAASRAKLATTHRPAIPGGPHSLAPAEEGAKHGADDDQRHRDAEHRVAEAREPVRGQRNRNAVLIGLGFHACTLDDVVAQAVRCSTHPVAGATVA